MSSNSSDASIIANLNIISGQLNRYLSITILLFGTIGNILNCIALSRRTLRLNPCSLIFLVLSIVNLITLISGVAVRLLAGWSADLTDTIGWLCKLRIYILFISRNAASWLTTLATFDRWLSSSVIVRHRQLSTLKNAQRGMIIIICLSCIAYCQLLYCFEANLTNTPVKCYGRTALCTLINDFEFTFVSVIIPSLLMLAFGLMTIFNVRKAALRRVQPVVTGTGSRAATITGIQSQQAKKVDHYLLMMLFIQVILLTLFPLPQVSVTLYTNLTRGQIRSPLQNTITNFVVNLSFLLTYITNGMPFYIYTLSGGIVFRKALLDGIREIISIIKCRQN